MDLSKVPEKGTMLVSDYEVHFFRKDNVIYVPVEESIFMPVVVDGTVIAKELKFKVITTAKCNPEDKFSLKYGVRRAYARALERLYAQVEKAERRNGVRLPSQLVARDLSQVKNELKAMETKFEKARQLKLAE